MSFPFNQVRRMEKSGMEFYRITQFAQEYKKGITERTIRNIYEDPCAKRQLHTVKAVREAHDAVFQKTVHCYRIGVSPGLQDLVDRYNRAYQGKKNEDFEHEMEAIKKSVTEEIEFYPEQSDYGNKVIWRRASLHWILGRILSDELRDLRENPRKKAETDSTKVKALKHYDEARKLYLHLYSDSSGLANIAYAFELNRIMVIFNSIPIKNRRENHEIIGLFNSNNRHHRTLCLELINNEYFQWQAARNLMTDCQYVEDVNGYIEAFQLLVKACPKFKDLSYNPGLVDAIRKDDDTNRYMDVLLKKKIAK